MTPDEFAEPADEMIDSLVQIGHPLVMFVHPSAMFIDGFFLLRKP